VSEAEEVAPAACPEAGGEVELPEGVLAVRIGPGANCSSAGSAIDLLFYGSVVVGAVAVALAAAFPPRERKDDDRGDDGAAGDGSGAAGTSQGATSAPRP
jgi:hypothetical protein